MAQSYDKYELDNDNGKAFRLALNDILEASATQNSGPNSPNTSNTSYPYQVWVDETNDIVKIRDAATAGSWYSLYSVDSDGKPTGAVSYGSYTIATNDTAGTGGTPAITVDTSQNVGIGATSPSEKLDVSGTGDIKAAIQTTSTGTGANAALRLKTGAYNWLLQTGDTVGGGLRFFDSTNSSERARIDSSGRLLVGPTSSLNSGCVFQTQGDDTTRDWAIKYTGTSGSAETGIKFLDKNNAVNAQISNSLQNDGVGVHAADLVFKTATGGSLTERMRIQNDGTIINYGSVYFNYGTSYSFPISYSIGVGAIIFGNPNTKAYVIYSNSSSTAGVLLNTNATAWTSYTSESRLKDILGDVDSDQAWSLVRNIELKRYYYKDQDDKTGVSYAGPMADWLGVQDPELLIDTGRTDDEGPIHTFNQALLDVKALAALSAALKRIEQLEAKVAALESA